MTNLQAEPATERTIPNRLKQTKFSPPTATRPTPAPSDTPVSKKCHDIFHARKIHAILFVLMVAGNAYFKKNIFYKILHVYNIT